MDISIIVAMTYDGLMGENGKLPWRIKKDMKHFSDLTKGQPIVMGRKTYESLPNNYRPLPGRENIVLTRNSDYNPHPDVACVRTLNDAFDMYLGSDKVFIGGGSEVYKLALPVADSLEITWVDGEYKGDTYFPKVDWKKWEKVSEEAHPEDKITFARYERKSY